MSYLVYCSGPISATNYDGAVNWYEAARSLLDDNIDLLRPMRGSSANATTGKEIGHFASDDPRSKVLYGNNLSPILKTRAAITGRDRFDTQRADAVLMNLLGANGKVSIGCMIEAGWADSVRIPIVLVCQDDHEVNPHAGHAILESLATYRCSTLEEGCNALNILFSVDSITQR